MGQIYADVTCRRVIWRMSAEEARTVAQFLRDELPRDDEGQGDAWALDAAAESVDPRLPGANLMAGEHHDDRCESEWESGAMAYTPCGCDQRATALARSVVDDPVMAERFRAGVERVRSTPGVVDDPNGADERLRALDDLP